MSIGTIALGDIFLNFTILFLTPVILHEPVEEVYYLYYFLFAACGPALGFVATLFFPPTEDDKERTKKCREIVDDSVQHFNNAYLRCARK